MEHQKKIKELKTQLSRWKSHKETNGHPSDNMLYDVLDGLLDLLHGEEEDNDIEAPESGEEISQSGFAPASDGDGSNPPNGPGTPP